jgi:hypothetical protein
MNNLKRLVTIGCLLSAVLTAHAQNDDCELTISRALDEFNAGHFYGIPSILSPCLNQFTKEQSQRAYLLLTQTYLLLDDPIGAKQSYINVLKANPEFVTDTAIHPIDVIYLSKKFTATSIFSWTAKAGANISMVRPIYDLNAVGDPAVKKKYTVNVGYQAFVGGDLNLTEKISLRGELGYTQASFGKRIYNYFTKDSTVVKERESWLSAPFTLIYSDNIGKYRPYGYAGYGIHYLLGSKTGVTVTNNKPLTNKENERDESPAESPDLNTRFKRNLFNQSIVVGGGLKVKVGLDFVFVDLRYNIGLKNVTSRKNVYGNNRYDPTSPEYVQSNELAMRYGEVQDFFRLDNLSISVGFLRPLYKPRELKRARTRQVMKQIKR